MRPAPVAKCSREYRCASFVCSDRCCRPWPNQFVLDHATTGRMATGGEDGDRWGGWRPVGTYVEADDSALDPDPTVGTEIS
jgi:hypothetical protein